MSWLEKMGLVEKNGVPEVDAVAEMPMNMPTMEVAAEVQSTTNIVDDVYAQNGLSDKNDSIYTVRALIETLPGEMTTAKKQSTVAGILAVSGKQIGDLRVDAKTRIDVLCAARDKIISDRTDEITAANADIEGLKKLIESATIKIKEAEDIIDATKKSVEDEIGVIEALDVFCEGMEGAQ